MGESTIFQLLPHSINGFMLVIPLLVVGYNVSTLIYNIFFHKLKKFPGPFFGRISVFPIIYHNLKGDLPYWTIKQHERHGDVVRLSPHELSFSGADAYRDIYGHKRAGKPTLEKDPKFYRSPFDTTDIVNSNFEDHARQRRIFSNAFSDRALKLQEPLFLTYVDKLIEKLHEGVAQDPKRPFNMVRMFNYTTFDIMGDLTFGESLDMLTDSSYHPWVAAMVAGFKYGVYIHSIRYFGALENFLMRYCIPDAVLRKMELHREFTAQRVNRRLEKQEERPDIWGLVLGRDGKSGLTRNEMYSNANIFMIAGTETTATLLSGLTFYLLQNPTKLEKLTTEIRSEFATEDEITIERLQALRYLNAAIEEGLRMFPPVASKLPRLTPPGEPTTIDGHEVPPDTTVYVSNLAANRNPNTWRTPYDFVPERWLSDAPESPLFAGDKKHGFQPFSTGPRACLGKNMAYHEIRVILTKVLYNFDLELCEESRDWLDMQIFILWEKKPLYYRLRPVRRV